MKIKIIGGGSAGNHIAFALSKLNGVKKIFISDLSPKILKRSKKIYIQRYKKKNKKIQYLIENNKIEKNFYDAIIVSTPPLYHKKNIEKNLNQSNVFLVEKPLCDPSLNSINFFEKLNKKFKKKIFLCGYNHRLFPSTLKLKSLIKNDVLNFCRVSFKENISGFLKAHNWLKSINESYLSITKQGGGALCEHSHALNLLQFFMNDKIKTFKIKNFNFVNNKKNYHDTQFSGILNSNICIGEFDQNFETLPVEKTVEIFSNKKIYKLTYNFEESNDCIEIFYLNGKYKKLIFKKKRSDDFLYEAKHLIKIIKQRKNIKSPIDLNYSLKTIRIINKLLKNLI